MEVVAGVLLQKGRVLLAQRPLNKNHGGLWEFPGGKKKKGETLTTALTRELLEELGVLIKEVELQYLGVVEGKGLSLHLFLSLLNSPYTAIEHRAVAWLDFKHLSRPNLCPTDQMAIEQLGPSILKNL